MRTKRMVFGALAIVLLAACSNDENETMIDNTGNRATFSASIRWQVQTRAFDQMWNDNDKIGISGKTGDKTYTNVAYFTANGGKSGSFSVVTPGEEIYYQDNEPVTFTAYYPWEEALKEGTFIETDTWGQADQKSFDYLWSQAIGSKGTPNVTFSFNHVMTKVVLTIKKGADVSLDEVKAAVMTLESFEHTGKFDVTTGETTTYAGTTVMWNFANNSDNENYNAPVVVDETAQTVTYTLIMFPQKFDKKLPIHADLTGKQTFKAELDFTEANKKAGDENPENKWVEGRQYNLSVTLHKTKITVDGCEIVQWENVDGGDFKAE